MAENHLILKGIRLKNEIPPISFSCPSKQIIHLIDLQNKDIPQLICNLITGDQIPFSGDILLKYKSILHIPKQKRNIFAIEDTIPESRQTVIWYMIQHMNKEKTWFQRYKLACRFLDSEQILNCKYRFLKQLNRIEWVKIQLLCLTTYSSSVIVDKCTVESKDIQKLIDLDHCVLQPSSTPPYCLADDDLYIMLRNGRIVQCNYGRSIRNTPQDSIIAQLYTQNNLIKGNIVAFNKNHVAIDVNGIIFQVRYDGKRKIGEQVKLCIPRDSITVSDIQLNRGVPAVVQNNQVRLINGITLKVNSNEEKEISDCFVNVNEEKMIVVDRRNDLC